ncbi:MAG: hypothetical protein HYZ75_06560 [Elusimicrobia bacterium]|nr:hypothetical protein [Elusimicrobiota bacterium]
MLAELQGVSQPGGQPGRRRWFADEEMDLIIWQSESGALLSFQLCYDKTGFERAFSWKDGAPPTHAAVDQGEDLPTDNRSPVLLPDGRPPLAAVVADFRRRAVGLDAGLVARVVAVLEAFRPGA